MLNHCARPTTCGRTSKKKPNLLQPESETMKKLRLQIRDTQAENEKAVTHVKTLEAETVKIAGLFASLSSRLTGLEKSVTNCVTQSGITPTTICNMKASLDQDILLRQQKVKEF